MLGLLPQPGKYLSKVHIFWEDHKILKNLHRKFDRYYIGQIYEFVAFSEYTNFKATKIDVSLISVPTAETLIFVPS